MTWTRDVDPHEKGYSRQGRASDGCSRLHGSETDNRDFAFPIRTLQDALRMGTMLRASVFSLALSLSLIALSAVAEPETPTAPVTTAEPTDLDRQVAEKTKLEAETKAEAEAKAEALASARVRAAEAEKRFAEKVK